MLRLQSLLSCTALMRPAERLWRGRQRQSRRSDGAAYSADHTELAAQVSPELPQHGQGQAGDRAKCRREGAATHEGAAGCQLWCSGFGARE